MSEIHYINASVAIAVPILIDGTAITTTYTSGAIMNDPSTGKGVCRFSVYDSAGAIALSNGVPMQDIYCYRDATNSGQGDATISFGFQAADTFSIVPVYGVRDSGGNLNWRELTIQEIKIYAPKSANGIVVAPTMPT